MNALSSVVLSLLAGSAAAAGITLALRSDSDGGASPVVTGLQASVEQLQQENAELKRQLTELAARPAPAAATSAARVEAPTVTEAQVAAAVEAYLRGRGDGAAEASVAADPSRPFDLEEDFEALVGTSYWDNPEGWKRAFEAGKMDEVIEKLEALAADDPNDIGAKMTLASAYLSYLQMDQSKWPLSMKADKQYDAVLAIDQNHWDARFSKAVSYTFWPPLMGKQKEAITHFEKLVAQQEKMPVTDEQAQTYLYLGNMLAGNDPERAEEIWRKGLQRHPNNAALLEKLNQ